MLKTTKAAGSFGSGDPWNLFSRGWKQLSQHTTTQHSFTGRKTDSKPVEKMWNNLPIIVSVMIDSPAAGWAHFRKNRLGGRKRTLRNTSGDSGEVVTGWWPRSDSTHQQKWIIFGLQQGKKTIWAGARNTNLPAAGSSQATPPLQPVYSHTQKHTHLQLLVKLQRFPLRTIL